jgi:hypothetical protein
MIKPLTFEEYWNACVWDIPKTDPMLTKLRRICENSWNQAILEATDICNNKLKEYKESAFVDLELVEDICKEIKSLKSNN